MDGSMEHAISRELLGDATACLIGVATSIEWLYESNHGIELLEAKRAIHDALVAMAGWNRSLDDVQLDSPPPNTELLSVGSRQ